MSPNKYDKMYMDIALRAAQESKCPRTHTGCCFLLESGVISIGFNGKEPGGPNEWDWTPDGDNEVIHAEEQCIRKLLAEGLSAKNATVYLTLSPCLSCAKLLTGAKVKRVVYLEAYRKTEGIDYLAKYGVEVQKFGDPPKIPFSNRSWTLINGSLIPTEQLFYHHSMPESMQHSC